MVPDTFMVLLSQRRRWINSTIHNLMELLFVHDLCGTFCFSMQFVIFMELVGTLALPAAISFTLYLIVMACLGQPALIPLLLLAVILGLPAVLIVMTSRKIIYVGWMLVYLISLPIWNFVLPTYAYWHFDDFSWGDTRKVEGAVADKKGGHADKSGEFDSSMITMKKWSEFEKDRRIKEALDRNMLPPRFVEKKSGNSIDVFRESPIVVKRYSKTGSAGSNDSDVPLTQMGYNPAGSTPTGNVAHHNNHYQSPRQQQQQQEEVMVDDLAIEENHDRRVARPPMTGTNQQGSATTSSSDSSVGPDIPLNTMMDQEQHDYRRSSTSQHQTSFESSSRPRAVAYNAGLAHSGIEDFEAEEDASSQQNDTFLNNTTTTTTYNTNWSDPAPHHFQQQPLQMHRFEFEQEDQQDNDSRLPYHKSNIPMPPPHGNNNNSNK